MRNDLELRATEDACAILARMLSFTSELGAMDWLFVYGAFKRLTREIESDRRAQASEGF